jgi:hypothetical protein
MSLRSLGISLLLQPLLLFGIEARQSSKSAVDLSETPTRRLFISGRF